jgi:hypothetical protein
MQRKFQNNIRNPNNRRRKVIKDLVEKNRQEPLIIWLKYWHKFGRKSWEEILKSIIVLVIKI